MNAVDTLIGAIVPPESLMKTLTDRKLAEEQKITYETEMLAQETRQALEKETAVADMQKEIVKADQGCDCRKDCRCIGEKKQPETPIL